MTRCKLATTAAKDKRPWRRRVDWVFLRSASNNLMKTQIQEKKNHNLLAEHCGFFLNFPAVCSIVWATKNKMACRKHLSWIWNTCKWCVAVWEMYTIIRIKSKLHSFSFLGIKRKRKRSDSVLTKAPTPAEMSKEQSDKTNNATKKFD